MGANPGQHGQHRHCYDRPRRGQRHLDLAHQPSIAAPIWRSPKRTALTSVIAGDGVTYTYTISVTNGGPSDAQNVSFTDTWPTGFTRGTLPAGCSNISGGPNFTCALGTHPRAREPGGGHPDHLHRAIQHDRQPAGQLGHRQLHDLRPRRHRQQRLRYQHRSDPGPSRGHQDPGGRPRPSPGPT